MEKIETTDSIVLSNEEKELIAAQRRDLENLESFKAEYNDLVNKYKFAWVVDGNSPLNSVKLGIAKVN